MATRGCESHEAVHLFLRIHRIEIEYELVEIYKYELSDDLKIFNLKQVYEASYVQSMGSYFLICRMYETKLLPDEFVIKEYVSLHKFGTFKTRPKIDLEVRALVQRAKLKS
jgi:hypothetical protein